MGSRRGGRNRDRKRDRFSRTAPQLEQEAAAAPPAAVAAAAAALDDAGRMVVVADPWFVQFADLTGCDVDGCPEVAVPEAWELVDLHTGDEQPGRFCDDHQLAWITRPRETTSTAGGLASP